MRKVWEALMALAIIAMIAFSGTGLAFSDLIDDASKEKIEWLKKEGILEGRGNNLFAPDKDLTVAEGIHMIVKGMKLNLDHVRFIKAPKASDYFTHVPDDAWYAESFIIAHHNGLNLPKDIHPNRSMTKEEFSYYLGKTLLSKGEFVFIELYIMMKDEEQVQPEYMDVIQKMLIAKIAQLDRSQYFHPKQMIQRQEAAVMLYNAIQFLKKYEIDEQGNPALDPNQPVESGKIENPQHWDYNNISSGRPS